MVAAQEPARFTSGAIVCASAARADQTICGAALQRDVTTKTQHTMTDGRVGVGEAQPRPNDVDAKKLHEAFCG